MHSPDIFLTSQPPALEALVAAITAVEPATAAMFLSYISKFIFEWI
jgi:hypothetical protein